MGLTLLIAEAGDRWAIDIERELIRRQHPVTHVQPQAFIESHPITYPIGGSADSSGSVSLNVTHCGFEGDALSSVLVRTSVGALTLPPDLFSAEDESYARTEWVAALFGWLHALSCPVVNVPIPGRSVHLSPSHPVLRAALSAVGMHAGASVVVSDIESAVKQYDAWNRHVRVQVLAPGSLAIELRGAKGSGVLEGLASQGPVAMQRVPEGRRLSAVVVGQRVVGGCWRTAVQGGQLRESILDPTTISPQLVQQCRQIARMLTQPVATVDMVLAYDETVYCLGASDMPDHGICSDHMRQLLVRHVSNILDRTEEWSRHDSAFRSHSRSHRGQFVRPIGCQVR